MGLPGHILILQRTKGQMKTGDMVSHFYVRHHFASSCGPEEVFVLLPWFWHAHRFVKAPDVSTEFLNEQAN